MRAWGITDVGLRRRENQDTYAIELHEAEETAVAVVCDGMGGVSGGRLASSTAVSTFMEEVRVRLRAGMTPEQLREMESFCVAQANSAVYRRSLELEGCHGMGTTLVSAIACADGAMICNVGDSRAYHIGQDGIRRITRDHSVVETLLEAGDITPEEARTHPNRNIITRALGPDSAIDCDAYGVSLSKGDCLLLCSDGLVVTMTDEEMREIVCAEEDGGRALERLVALARGRGAPDNVTAVLIRNDKEVERRNG